MTGRPFERVWTVKGIDPRRAPPHLQPYLDCVDGAVAVGGKIDLNGRQTHSIWELHRGGRPVGRVTIAEPKPKPIPPTDLDEARRITDRLVGPPPQPLRWWIGFGIGVWAAIFLALFMLGRASAS